MDHAVAAHPALPLVEAAGFADRIAALPLRCPWLSRLLQQLEAAAHQRPAFASAPVLGDRVDRSA